MHTLSKLVLAPLALAAVLVAAPSAARADASCSSLIGSLVTWAQAPDSSNYHRIWVQGGAVQKDNRWVGFSEGELGYDASKDRLVGRLSTTFSDRTDWWNGVLQRFLARAADATDYEIARDGTVYATSVTWGGGQVRIAASCRETYLTFFDGWSLSTLAFSNFTRPKIH